MFFEFPPDSVLPRVAASSNRERKGLAQERQCRSWSSFESRHNAFLLCLVSCNYIKSYICELGAKPVWLYQWLEVKRLYIDCSGIFKNGRTSYRPSSDIQMPSSNVGV